MFKEFPSGNAVTDGLQKLLKGAAVGSFWEIRATYAGDAVFETGFCVAGHPVGKPYVLVYTVSARDDPAVLCIAMDTYGVPLFVCPAVFVKVASHAKFF